MRLLLIRHGATDDLGRVLTGWTPGVQLNAEGRAQAARAAERLAGVPVRAIYTSPVERARETAEAIALPHGLTPVVREPLGEVRLGDWTGRTFESLRGDADWGRFNSFRAGSRPPGGEWMVEVQARVVGEIQRLREEHAEGTIAVVSHGDPIKAALFHYGGISLDLMLRWQIAPASVSILELTASGVAIVAVNDSGGPPW
jgi:broad specificity phosphatase PhoE